MPFTLSHPAAAVPLSKYGLPLSALVVGSMAPDFPYFLDLSISNQYGHTLQGIFLFCLPAGLCALWLFHMVMKRPLIALLPRRFAGKVAANADSFAFWPLPRLVLILLALFVGTLSHIVWDSFTHGNAWPVRHLPFLQTVVFRSSFLTLPLFMLLQYASSAFGAIFLLLWCRNWLVAAPESSDDIAGWRLTRPLKIGVMVGILVVYAKVFHDQGINYILWYTDPDRVTDFAREAVVTAIAVFAQALFVYCCVWQCVSLWLANKSPRFRPQRAVE